MRQTHLGLSLVIARLNGARCDLRRHAGAQDVDHLAKLTSSRADLPDLRRDSSHNYLDIERLRRAVWLGQRLASSEMP